MRKIAMVSLIAASFAGCASPTPHIVQSYVPIGTYGNYGCFQLSDEMQRITRRLTELAGVQDQIAREDTIKTGVAAAGLATAGVGGAALAGAFGGAAAGPFFFGGGAPAVGSSAQALGIAGVAAGSTAAATGGLLIHGNDGNTNQLALLKGELDAAERAYIQKGCGHEGYSQRRPVVRAAY